MLKIQKPTLFGDALYFIGVQSNWSSTLHWSTNFCSNFPAEPIISRQKGASILPILIISIIIIIFLIIIIIIMTMMEKIMAGRECKKKQKSSL